MIKFNKISNEIPYKIFKKLYTKSKKANQTNIESNVIASYFSKNDEVNARFVNLKMVNDKEFIFFQIIVLKNLKILSLIAILLV